MQRPTLSPDVTDASVLEGIELSRCEFAEQTFVQQGGDVIALFGRSTDCAWSESTAGCGSCPGPFRSRLLLRRRASRPRTGRSQPVRGRAVLRSLG